MSINEDTAICGMCNYQSTVSRFLDSEICPNCETRIPPLIESLNVKLNLNWGELVFLGSLVEHFLEAINKSATTIEDKFDNEEIYQAFIKFFDRIDAQHLELPKILGDLGLEQEV